MTFCPFLINSYVCKKARPNYWNCHPCWHRRPSGTFAAQTPPHYAPCRTPPAEIRRSQPRNQAWTNEKTATFRTASPEWSWIWRSSWFFLLTAGNIFSRFTGKEKVRKQRVAEMFKKKIRSRFNRKTLTILVNFGIKTWLAYHSWNFSDFKLAQHSKDH